MRCIRVRLSPGSAGLPADQLDGRYVIPLSGFGDADPRIEVEVMGEPLYEGPLSGIDGGGRRRFSLSWHAGVTAPLGDFDRFLDGDVLFELDLERPLSNRWSLRGVLGFYRFDPSFDILGGTVYLRRYLPRPGGLRLFGEIGAGLYDPEFLDPAFGLSAGIGLDRSRDPQSLFAIRAYVFRLLVRW